MNRAVKRHQKKLARKAAKNRRGHPPRPLGQNLSGAPANHVSELIQKGVRLHQAGQVQEAEAIYRQVLATDPNHDDANHLLGVLLAQAGNHAQAVELISRAIAMAPDQPMYHNNLGTALQELGRLDDALASYRRALAIKPDYVEAHSNLGNVLQNLGRLEEAVVSYHQALAIKPNYAEAHNNLGNALQALGRLEEAVASYHKALATKPDSAGTRGNLGGALLELGQPADAFACLRSAIALEPQNDLFWAGLAECLESLSFISVDDNLLQDLFRLIERPTVRPHAIARSVISALRQHPDFSKFLELTRPGRPEAEIDYADAAVRLGAIPLLLRIMALSSVQDLDVEGMFTILRRAMIQETTAGKTDEKGLPFSAALALHCFTIEYVFSETAEEKVAVERLQQQIATLVEDGQEVRPALVATLGAYRSLHRFSWANKLLEREWTGAIKEVILRQIAEPMEEQSLRSQIPRLTPIRNSVSQAVRGQYEENSYPRWINPGIAGKAETVGNLLRGSPLCLDLGDYQSPESPEILVAGCGTGQHALETASKFLNSRVLAVDLSLSSLTYAARKTRDLGFSNIEYAQGDIMELGSLGRRFDLIECVGVLHHLGDPLAGWRVLVDLLRPRGLMRIGLYSEAARQDVVAARSLIAEQGYMTSREDIRRCRQDILAMAKDSDSEITKICGRNDFFTLSACRDLLFHVQEHRFTLPRIDAALKSLELRFLGFESPGQRALKEFTKSHPNGGALTSLSLWHEFELENPHTFGSMYLFWCKKM